MYGKDAPHHRGVLQRSASTSTSSSLFSSRRQRLILAPFSHVQRCFHCFVLPGASGVSAQCRGSFSFPLPRSPSPFHAHCRSAPASGRPFPPVSSRKPDGQVDVKGKGRMAAPFSKLPPPDESITKSDAQIGGGETRQDLKITGVSPGNSLVRSPVPAFHTPVSFHCYGRVCLIPRLTLSSMPADSLMDCFHEPPFSPATPRLQSNCAARFQSLKTQRIATGGSAW